MKRLAEQDQKRQIEFDELVKAKAAVDGPVLAVVHDDAAVVGRVLAGPPHDLRLVHDHASDPDQARAKA